MVIFLPIWLVRLITSPSWNSSSPGFSGSKSYKAEIEILVEKFKKF